MGSKSVFILIISAACLSVMMGCQPRISTITAIEGTQTLPETYENPQELPGPAADETEILNIPDAPVPQPKVIPQELVTSTPPSASQFIPRKLPNLPRPLLRPPAVLLSKKVTGRPGLPRASKFIISAEWVMINEGKKIGTPCNFYLSRVLVLSGYSSDRFLATDFDVYAKKNLKNSQVLHFVNDGNGSEMVRLKQHLWSFPERTPFIMQWSRSGAIGHVAIVERVGSMLIIYQASLNKYSARKDYTSISRLLSGQMRRTLSVYSGF